MSQILGRKAFKGRGTLTNPPGRFEKNDVEEVHDGWYEEGQPDSIATTVSPDTARAIIARNDSPDIPFEQSINPYRGCEHGCIYCYARPSHAFMGLSSGIDFETRLFYKVDAGRVLAEELSHPRYVCKPITIGANTDPYQPVEREMKVTRSVLEVLARTRHPASIITKSALILRDIELLADMARDNLMSVAISITTLTPETKRVLEPRTASPQARLRALRELNAAGIPTGVMSAPVIPAITDHEMESILEAAVECGARWAGYTVVRLPYEIKETKVGIPPLQNPSCSTPRSMVPRQGLLLGRMREPRKRSIVLSTMRTRTGLTLVSLAAAMFAVVGCASKQAQEAPPSVAVAARDCEHSDNNLLHLTAETAVPEPDHDPELDRIWTQQTSDWRLAQINTQMYQSLRTLDAELRKEQRIAACERSPFADALQAQANKQQSSVQQPSGGAPLPSDADLGAQNAIKGGIPPLQNPPAQNGVVASSVVSSGVATGANRTNSLRKTSMSPSPYGGGGNGAIGPKGAPGSDNEIVLRRLRKAAEQETNPSLRAKLWKEYTDYKQGVSAK